MRIAITPLIDATTGRVSVATKCSSGEASQVANWLKAVAQFRRPSK